MINKTPIAIIFPVLNDSLEMLQYSIGSIIKQTFQSYELIVINESSCKFVREYLNKLSFCDPRVRIVTPKHKKGLAYALNFGLTFTNAKYIARADADDFQLKNRLKFQYDFLETNPCYDVVGSCVNILDEELNFIGHKIYPEYHNHIHKVSAINNPLCHPSVMFRRILIDKYGKYDESYKAAEDYELWLRWISLGVQFYNLQIPLVNYTVANISRRAKKNWKFNLKAKIKYFSFRYFFRRILGISLVVFLYLAPKFILCLLFNQYKKVTLVTESKD